MKLHEVMSNLVYVKIDRQAAREHWSYLVDVCELHPSLWANNRRMLTANKVVAGILGHRQTRGFVFYRAKERAIARRLQ